MRPRDFFVCASAKCRTSMPLEPAQAWVCKQQETCFAILFEGISHACRS